MYKSHQISVEWYGACSSRLSGNFRQQDYEAEGGALIKILPPAPKS